MPTPFQVVLDGSSERALQSRARDEGKDVNQVVRAIVTEALQKKVEAERESLIEDLRSIYEKLGDGDLDALRKLIDARRAGTPLSLVGTGGGKP